jgi:thioesterase domain-containing protein
VVEYLGRLDNQVKLRGFRIEPGEIEAVLAGHPEVRECAVLVREDTPGVRLLVAYLVGFGAPPEAGAIRAWLAERLPEYMLPAAYVNLEALPLTANGKLDRRALPTPDQLRGPEHLAPRDALELELVRIWEEALGTRPVGVRDDFFALGGHSLLAVQVTSRIESRLGRSLPLATLLRHPTVERLAAVLREDAGPIRPEPLVELAPEAGKTAGKTAGRPLFLVHPAGGEVFCYVPLARHLGDRAVYGLQVTAEAGSIEEMAERYLRHVREVQPEGPYLLGGWSLGGTVAFEMARQLEASGETVERVILIDSYAPGERWNEPLGERELVASFAIDLARLLGIGGLPIPESFEALVTTAEETGLLPPGFGRAELERRFALFAASYRAVASYWGGPCSAPLLLLRAAEPAGGEPDRGWEPVAGQPVEAHELPGDHYTLLQEPTVESLAGLLRQRCPQN